jgi:hypothetical protein
VQNFVLDEITAQHSMHLDVPESSVREEMVITSPEVEAYDANLHVVLQFATPYISGRCESRTILPFSTRHWQQVEAGRPITVTTHLRICEVFTTPMSKLVQGLDGEGVYETLEPMLTQRRHRRP